MARHPGRHTVQLPLARAAVSQTSEPNARRPRRFTVAGLFAGIGGFEIGLGRAGHEAAFLCEIDPGAAAVLRSRLAGVPLHDDICRLKALPTEVDLVVAGFPCQDLSQAGRTVGIAGARSGLVGEVFRLLARHEVPWVVLENVPFMLQLAKGRALAVVIDEMERLGYRWAYRVIDTLAFGLPQRRERVFFVATLDGDPRDVLLADDEGPMPREEPAPEKAFGFYWTEGIRGLGAAVDAIPTLKGGSTIGIPSPPAILLPNGELVKPDIRDAERMQGFEPGWTTPSDAVARRGHRWKLVGNAVTVDVVEWLGHRLAQPGQFSQIVYERLDAGRPWPRAAFNVGSGRFATHSSSAPVMRDGMGLASFLQFPPEPLSTRATAGFLLRAKSSSLRFPPGFIAAVESHLDRMQCAPTA